MMMLLQPLNLPPLDRNSGRGAFPSTSTPPCGVGSAAFVLAEELSQQPQRVHHAHQDPSAYYEPSHGPTMSSSSSTHKLAQNDDGYTRPTETIGIHGDQGLDHLQHAKMRPVPYHAAVRLANRSNEAAPLATIIEQGSYSTLNSRSSLLSVGRFPSISTAENVSPTCASHRVSQHLYDSALQRIQGNVFRERDPLAGTAAHPKPQFYGSAHPMYNTTTPIKARSLIYPYLPSSQISETDYDADGRPVRQCFRSVLHNVRAASRTRSRSSSAPFVDAQEDRLGSTESSRLNQLPPCGNLNQRTHDDHYQISPLQTSSSSAASTPTAGLQARSSKTSVTCHHISAHATPSLVDSSLTILDQESNLGFISHLSPPLAATRPLEPPPSVRLVPPESRNVACNAATAGPLTFSNHTDGSASARYTFYGVTVAHKNASSLLEHDRARETSRNASFCSTMSTSYSETVLGVDLDLEHDFPHSVRRSSSPMPV
jgi:hypothetical protein